MATTSRAAEGHMGGQVPCVGEHMQQFVGHMGLSRFMDNARKGQDYVVLPTGSPRSS